MLPKLFITDVDGVLTDGGMYYDEQGNELKKFNTSDSAGVSFLKLLGIPVAMMTGENTAIVQSRAEKLKIDFVYQGAQNKLKIAEQLLSKMGITFSEVAYIGDDMNDIFLLKKVGFPASPANAPDYVKKYAKYITTSKGGEGSFREFVETILKENNLLESVIENYLTQILNEKIQ